MPMQLKNQKVICTCGSETDSVTFRQGELICPACQAIYPSEREERLDTIDEIECLIVCIPKSVRAPVMELLSKLKQ